MNELNDENDIVKSLTSGYPLKIGIKINGHSHKFATPIKLNK